MYSTHDLKTIKNWVYEVLEVEKVTIFKKRGSKFEVQIWYL